MSYGLINGQLVNGDEEEGSGIDLVSHGIGTMVVLLVGQSAQPLELGAVQVKNGQDVAVGMYGLDLVRHDLGVLTIGQPPVNQVLVGQGARPLELGAPTAVPEAMTITGTSAQPLVLGEPGPAGLTLLGTSAEPLEMGDPGPVVRYIGGVGSAYPLELGLHSTSTAVSIEGIDLVAHGVGLLAAAGVVLQGQSHQPLELGQPAQPGRLLYGRQHFPLALGDHRIDRGTAC